MCDQIRIRSACAYTQSDQSLMSVKLLIEHHLEFLNLKGAAHARLSLIVSKYHIGGKYMSGLIFLHLGEMHTLMGFIRFICELLESTFACVQRLMTDKQKIHKI